MMTSVTGRKYVPDFTRFYKKHNLLSGVNTFGMGTASVEVLDYFGLEDDEKGIFFGIVTEDTWKEMKKGLIRELNIEGPGVGIVFIIPVSSVAGKRQLQFLIGSQSFEKGEESGLKDTKFELIVAIANYGYNDMVMEAAKEGGAFGGTVLHGKGVGLKHAETFFGVSLVSEKEIILIVSKSERKNAIMKSVMEKAGTSSKAGTICFSLPVTDTAGMHLPDEE